MTSDLSIEALQLALHVGNSAQGGDRLITDIGEPGGQAPLLALHTKLLP
jgi:hypothetical protein